MVTPSSAPRALCHDSQPGGHRSQKLPASIVGYNSSQVSLPGQSSSEAQEVATVEQRPFADAYASRCSNLLQIVQPSEVANNLAVRPAIIQP